MGAGSSIKMHRNGAQFFYHIKGLVFSHPKELAPFSTLWVIDIGDHY
jgi:hypothetical protein